MLKAKLIRPRPGSSAYFGFRIGFVFIMVDVVLVAVAWTCLGLRMPEMIAIAKFQALP